VDVREAVKAGPYRPVPQPDNHLRRKRPHCGLLNVCLISPGDTILNLMRIAPMQKINFREYLAVATALVIIVAFFHQWVLTF
jgi:hypothetical protein